MRTCCSLLLHLFSTETKKARHFFFFFGWEGRDRERQENIYFDALQELVVSGKHFSKTKLPNEFTIPISFSLFPEKEKTAQKQNQQTLLSSLTYNLHKNWFKDIFTCKSLGGLSEIVPPAYLFSTYTFFINSRILSALLP